MRRSFQAIQILEGCYGIALGLGLRDLGPLTGPALDSVGTRIGLSNAVIAFGLLQMLTSCSRRAAVRAVVNGLESFIWIAFIAALCIAGIFPPTFWVSVVSLGANLVLLVAFVRHGRALV